MLSSILNRSMKGVVTGSFCIHPVDSLFYQQKFWKNNQIALSTNKIQEEDALAVLNHSTKGAMTDSFRREYFP